MNNLGNYMNAFLFILAYMIDIIIFYFNIIFLVFKLHKKCKENKKILLILL